MAAVDKIYGNSKMYFEFYLWAEENCEWLCEFFCYTPEEVPDRMKFPLTSFPILVDMYLLRKCPIEWVKEKISNQYVFEYGETIESIAKEEYNEYLRDGLNIPEQIYSWIKSL